MKNLIYLFFTMMVLAGCNATNVQQINHNEFKKCPDERPEICTMEYDPVCATLRNKTMKTYSNGCSACSDNQVVGYQSGECN